MRYWRFPLTLVLALSILPYAASQDQPGQKHALESKFSKLIVVSDIDDTIKWSDILDRGHTLLRSALSSNTAFKGMPELYSALAKKGVAFAYVTGAPDLILPELDKHALPPRVIRNNHFPSGTISMRLLPSRTEDFKVKTIGQIMTAHPDASFILIGDNGERDPISYHRLSMTEGFRERILGVYIHRLYNGGSSANPYPDQHLYLTAAELATMLYGSGLLDQDELHSVLMIVSKSLKDAKVKNRNLALPYAADLRRAQIEAIYHALPSVPDPDDKSLLGEIHQIIAARLTPRKVTLSEMR